MYIYIYVFICVCIQQQQKTSADGRCAVPAPKAITEYSLPIFWPPPSAAVNWPRGSMSLSRSITIPFSVRNGRFMSESIACVQFLVEQGTLCDFAHARTCVCV